MDKTFGHIVAQTYVKLAISTPIARGMTLQKVRKTLQKVTMTLKKVRMMLHKVRMMLQTYAL